MKFKSAFSLVEVLMVMGIISVILVLGLSISKRGVDSAYNLYWYTGYKALSDASYDAVRREVFDPSNNPEGSLCVYIDYIGTKLMNATSSACDGNEASFTAPNGISFSFEAKTGYYLILMSIPKHKQNVNTPNTTNLIYNFDKGLIYPANITTSSTKLNLHNRMDILPFYVNNGEQQNAITKVYGFRDAYCATDNSIDEGDDIIKITCSNDGEDKYGVITPINPRKVF